MSTADGRRCEAGDGGRTCLKDLRLNDASSGWSLPFAFALEVLLGAETADSRLEEPHANTEERFLATSRSEWALRAWDGSPVLRGRRVGEVSAPAAKRPSSSSGRE